MDEVRMRSICTGYEILVNDIDEHRCISAEVTGVAGNMAPQPIQEQIILVPGQCWFF